MRPPGLVRGELLKTFRKWRTSIGFIAVGLIVPLVHLAFHLGQAGYLRRALTGDRRTSGPITLKALAEG